MSKEKKVLVWAIPLFLFISILSAYLLRYFTNKLEYSIGKVVFYIGLALVGYIVYKSLNYLQR